MANTFAVEKRTSTGILSSIMATDNNIAQTILRVALGVVIFPHGAQKLLGWFGGHGFAGTMGFMTGSGIPAIFAVLAIVAESIGALALIFGFLGRVSAFGIACVMAVAAAMMHLGNGFFMNWTGAQAGEGFEYHLLVIAMAAVVMVKGSGAFSIDRMLAGKGRG